MWKKRKEGSDFFIKMDDNWKIVFKNLPQKFVKVIQCKNLCEG
jgi:hypothetical protein